MIAFAVITCSDTRSEKEDTAGAQLRELIADQGWQCVVYDVVKDERPEIAAAIVRAADEEKVDVVLTCGGTGLSLRDVTPEATRDVCEREVPGIAEGMSTQPCHYTAGNAFARFVHAAWHNIGDQFAGKQKSRPGELGRRS